MKKSELKAIIKEELLKENNINDYKKFIDKTFDTDDSVDEIDQSGNSIDILFYYDGSIDKKQMKALISHPKFLYIYTKNNKSMIELSFKK